MSNSTSSIDYNDELWSLNSTGNVENQVVDDNHDMELNEELEQDDQQSTHNQSTQSQQQLDQSQQQLQNSSSQESYGRNSFLQKCEKLWNDGIKREEKRIHEQISLCMEGKSVPLSPSIEDLEKELQAARQQIQKLEKELRKAEHNGVDILRILPTDSIRLGSSSKSTNIFLHNDKSNIIGWKIYVSADLVGCVAFAPNEGTLYPSESQTMKLTWSGKMPKCDDMSTLTFTIKWVSVPPRTNEDSSLYTVQFRDSWLMDRPIRQKTTLIQINQ